MNNIGIKMNRVKQQTLLNTQDYNRWLQVKFAKIQWIHQKKLQCRMAQLKRQCRQFGCGRQSRENKSAGETSATVSTEDVEKCVSEGKQLKSLSILWSIVAELSMKKDPNRHWLVWVNLKAISMMQKPKSKIDTLWLTATEEIQVSAIHRRNHVISVLEQSVHP